MKMGHSFDSGQGRFPRDIRSLGLLSSEKRRSVGRPRSREREDNYGAISDFLRTERPPEVTTFQTEPILSQSERLMRSESQSKKHSLDGTFRSKYLSSKQLKRLLQTRTKPPSSNSASTSASSIPVLGKDVALQKALSGKQYRQIVADPARVQSSGDLSVYKVNQPRVPKARSKPIAEGGDSKSEAAPGDGKLSRQKSQSQKIEHDAFGISKEFPHLVDPKSMSSLSTWPLSNGQSGLPQTSISFGSTETSTLPTSVPRQGIGPGVRDFAAQSSSTLSNTADPNCVKHPTTTLDDSSAALAVSQNKKALSHMASLNGNGGTRNWMQRSPRPSPLNLEARPHASPLLPSEPSAQNLNFNAGPQHEPPDSQTKKNSQVFRGGSITSKATLDPSSTTVISPQRVESMRHRDTGYYSVNGRKTPKPSGPAPTRALPLLPENQDPLQVGQCVLVGPEKSPTIAGTQLGRSLPENLSKLQEKGYDNSTFDIINSYSSSIPVRAMTSPDLRQHRVHTVASPDVLHTLPTTVDSEPSIVGMSAATLEDVVKKRDQVTKGRKQRDLERERTRLETKRQESINGIAAQERREEDNEDVIVVLPSLNGAYSPRSVSSGISLPGSQVSRSSELSTPKSVKNDSRERWRFGNDISPVIMIAEQEPVGGMEEKTKPFVSQEIRVNQSTQPLRTPSHMTNGKSPGPPSPCLPSSDEEGLHRRHQKPPPSSIPRRRILQKPSASSPLHAFPRSHPQPQSPSHAPSELESCLEARLSAFERKTALLEATLLFVLSTSATLGNSAMNPLSAPSSCADRSSAGRDSGWSARSSVYAPLEGMLEAMMASVAVNGGVRRGEGDG